MNDESWVVIYGADLGQIESAYEYYFKSQIIQASR